MVENIAQWPCRKAMIQSFGIGKVCAEIGVFRGYFSREILFTRPEQLWLIDAWEQQTGEYEQDPANAQDHESSYRAVWDEFSAIPCVRILRGWSLAAANSIPNNFFDWVYLDANHTWQGITNDIWAWWRKINVGGWLCGHDYGNNHPAIQVQPVVDAWAAIRRKPVFTTTDTEEGISWAIQK
jgi:hypothetical protein